MSGDQKDDDPQICIFIRGYPGVGKTTLARALGRELRCVTLLKDDVRAPTAAMDASIRMQLSTRGVQKDAVALVDSNAACYHVLNLIMKTQLDAYAQGVIVESPLGRASVARDAVEAAKTRNALCILVDCVLDRKEWSRRLNERSRQQETLHQDPSKGNIDTDDSSAHCIAHSAIQLDPDYIESLYPQGINFDIDGIDAKVKVDCAEPVTDGVKLVREAVECLLKSVTR